MANQPRQDRERIGTRHDTTLMDKVRSKAKLEGRNLNEVVDGLLEEYVDGPPPSPTLPATAAQVEEMKLGIEKMELQMQKFIAGIAQLAEQQQAALDGMQAKLLQAPEQASQPPVDLSGVEQAIAAMSGQIAELQAREALPAPQEAPVKVENVKEQGLAALDLLMGDAIAKNTVRADADWVDMLAARYALEGH